MQYWQNGTHRRDPKYVQPLFYDSCFNNLHDFLIYALSFSV